MQPYPQQPPPKKGLGALGIVLIILAVIAVLGLGTCVVCVVVVRSAAKDVVASINEGGALVLDSPPAVKADLAGAKKDYVGHWSSGHGSTMDIDSDGTFNFVKGEHGGNEKINAAIAAFSGNDIQVKAFVTLTVTISTPPHKVGDHWEIVADGITMQRK